MKFINEYFFAVRDSQTSCLRYTQEESYYKMGASCLRYTVNVTHRSSSWPH